MSAMSGPHPQGGDVALPTDNLNRSAASAADWIGSGWAECERPGVDPVQTRTGSASPPGFWTRFWRGSVLTQLRRVSRGRLTVTDAWGRESAGEVTASNPLDVHLHVQHPEFYRQIALGGIIGAAEAYIDGHWTCSNLTDLVRLIVLNRDIWSGLDRGWASWTEPLRKAAHFLHRNSRGQARRNIAAHYDLGNDFFRLFLDDTMMYSAGLFPSPEATLQDASIAKLDRICQKLDLGPGDHLLEIGTGWGGFAIHAAGRYGCRVTTTTISRAQHELAIRRVAEAGLSDRVEILFEDYRDLRGTYDKLVSIEMIEAVGHQWFDTYFAKCASLLKPDGLMLLQAITIADRDYPTYVRSVDFIQKYIFPGGCLPSVGAICDSLARKTDLNLFHLEDKAPHYARTLACWRDNLFRNKAEIQSLGPQYSDAFLRLWEFYFCYCEGAFLERSCGSVQMLLTKPHCRRPPLLGQFA
jgi:cyclopropane-fatty-acyl-phospholipid synthase